MKFEKFTFEDGGKKITFTCNELKLANLFGKNPEAPNFMTRVFFKKDVLDKYYGKPSKYIVQDGYLFYVKDNGINEWGVPLDNNADDCVMVYLGDLAKLPNEEQKHWKLHNIIKGKNSLVAFRRDIKAEFCSPTEPALYFKENLEIINDKWKNKFGWELFKPLNKEDEHHIKTLRTPNNEQKEFDELVLSLNKIIIDSLNIKEMKKDLSFNKGDKSIYILEEYLKQKHKFNSSHLVDFLKNLQNLRSMGSAHRKGSDYKKAYKKFAKEDLSETFKNILVQTTQMLKTIENNIIEESLKKSN